MSPVLSAFGQAARAGYRDDAHYGTNVCCWALKYDAIFLAKTRLISSLLTNGAFGFCALRNRVRTSGSPIGKVSSRLIDLYTCTSANVSALLLICGHCRMPRTST